MPFFAKWTTLRKNKRKDDVYYNLNKLFAIGIRLLLLGGSPDGEFRLTSCQRTSLYVLIIICFGGLPISQTVSSVFTEYDFLNVMSCVYFAIYFSAFGYQWIYLLVKLEDMKKFRLKMETFNSTQAVPVVAEAILTKKLKVFTRSLIIVVFVWIVTIFIFGVGSMIQAVVEFMETGEIEAENMINLPSIPLWVKLVAAVAEMIIFAIALAQTVAVYIISGLLSLEVDTQCAVICAAMAQDDGDGLELRGYIRDHVQVLRNAKWLINMLVSINSPATFSTYFLFALGMLLLTLVEPNGAFYIAFLADFIGTFIQFGAQGWFSTTITHSLQTVSFGAYNSSWYRKNKSYAIDVLIMSQMAQREYVQKLFFGSLRIERATVLNMIRSSYSFYTILIVLQSKN